MRLGWPTKVRIVVDAKGSIGKHRREPDHWVKDDLFARWE